MRQILAIDASTEDDTMRSCDDVIVITNLNKVGVLFQFVLYPAPKEFGTDTFIDKYYY